MRMKKAKALILKLFIMEVSIIRLDGVFNAKINAYSWWMSYPLFDFIRLQWQAVILVY